jgi:peptidoglycan hydrolase-like protein with peptidoglycan-binding domain
MSTAQQVLHNASSEIGYKENPPNSNHNKFGVWYGMDEEPWCAMFMSYCLYKAGLPLKITTDKGFAYCPYGVTWFKNKNWWHTNPEVGDLVFYDWDGDGEAKHVGIVEKINSDGSIVTIEGNTSVGNDSNGGQVMRRTRSDYIMGYGRPNYEAGGNVTPPAPHPLWPGRYITLTSPNVEGSDVLLWQRQMIHRGWTLSAGGSTGKGDDGIFSEDDHNVLVQFQEQKGLEVDGKIGPESWDAAWLEPITNE